MLRVKVPGLEVFKNVCRIGFWALGMAGLLSALLLLAACGGDDAGTADTVEPGDTGASAQTPVTAAGVPRIIFQSKRAGAIGDPGEKESEATMGLGTTANFDIWMIDIDGSNPVRLNDSTGIEQNPSWSPDGSKIAYSSGTRSPAGSVREKKNDIYVMNADGSDRKNITNDRSVEYQEPDWSPDGSKIAFTTKKDDNFEIYVMNSGGGNQTRLTDDPDVDTSPNWSPDGTKIVFVSFRDADPEIYVMNADGSNQTRITDKFGEELSPAWSPDGTKIAFVSDRDGTADIFVMDPDGSNPVNLTNGARDDRQPSWSGDGTKIVFYSVRDGDAELYVMDADGSNQTRLTEVENADSAPDWLWVP